MELIIISVVLLGILLIMLFFKRGKNLPKSVTLTAIQKINATKPLDPAHAIIEAHKIFIWTLASLVPENQRKTIHAADVVKKFAKRMPNEAQIWKTHRLRNRIAHEPDINISSTHADLARRDFVRALQSLSSK
jgi:hypothetical protein